MPHFDQTLIFLFFPKSCCPDVTSKIHFFSFSSGNCLRTKPCQQRFEVPKFSTVKSKLFMVLADQHCFAYFFFVDRFSHVQFRLNRALKRQRYLRNLYMPTEVLKKESILDFIKTRTTKGTAIGQKWNHFLPWRFYRLQIFFIECIPEPIHQRITSRS